MTDPRIWTRYRRYLSAPPELTVEWHDRPTGARGWLVLNSLRGGAAGGGTRMRAAVTREEVVYLAKAMELKFAFSGPAIGGGKSGIAFDPADPRRDAVLRRWFRAVQPYIATCYGTGGDVNVDEQRDVVPMCRALGLTHPQQGIVVGHLRARGADVEAALANLLAGLALPLGGDLGVEGADLTVSDMITGWGVARATARLLGGSVDGARVIVEGFGNVGAAAALYLARAGARIMGIVDAASGLAPPDGLGADAIADLVRRRRERALPEHPLRLTGPDRVVGYSVDADVMVPAAISGSLDGTRLEGLRHAGVQWIVCGANQPFREHHLGDTRTQERADRDFTIVADVVGSSGMARAFAHLMEGGRCERPEEVFAAVSDLMDDAVDRVVERAGERGPGMLAAAVDLALDRSGFDGTGLGDPGLGAQDVA